MTKELSTEVSSGSPSTDVRPPDLDPEAEARMSFTEHLAELRDRLVYSTYAILICLVVAYMFSEQIFNFIKQPLTPYRDSVTMATDEEGVFLSRITEGGARQWSAAMGVYLDGAEAVAFRTLADGREVIAANRLSASQVHEGLIVEVPAGTEEDGSEREPSLVQLWSGAIIVDVWPRGDNDYYVLHRRDFENTRKEDSSITDMISSIFGSDDEKEPDDAQFEVKDYIKDGVLLEAFPPSYVALQKGGTDVQWTTMAPMEGFMVQLKLAGYVGFILALPFVIYQICGFIFPGLKPGERRIVKIMTVGCGICGIAGIALAYQFIFPVILPFLVTYTPEGVLTQFRMSETVNFIIKGLIGFAIAFQMPMAVLVLVWLDLLQPETLQKYRRIAIVGIAVVSAVLTPPDPGSMLMMAVPLYLLYEISIIIAKIVVRRRKTAEPAAE